MVAWVFPVSPVFLDSWVLLVTSFHLGIAWNPCGMRLFKGERRKEKRLSGLSRFCCWLWGQESSFPGRGLLVLMTAFREKEAVDSRAEEGFKASSEAFQYYSVQSTLRAHLPYIGVLCSEAPNPSISFLCYAHAAPYTKWNFTSFSP